jgi:hypothetical protein
MNESAIMGCSCCILLADDMFSSVVLFDLIFYGSIFTPGAIHKAKERTSASESRGIADIKYLITMYYLFEH